MADRLDVDVHPTDAEALEAAAARVAERLAAGGPGRLSVALTGGRSGRGVLVALAARDDVPWARCEWYFADERCVTPGDGQSNLRVAQDSLLAPRVVPAEWIHAPALELGDPARIATAYAETLAASLGPEPVFDVVLLGLGPQGALGSLMPGSGALAAGAPVVVVPLAEVVEEPRVPRVTVTPRVLRAARAVVVTAVGDATATATAAALRDPDDPARCPAHVVRPNARVSWIIDRAAAAELLKGARRVD